MNLVKEKTIFYVKRWTVINPVIRSEPVIAGKASNRWSLRENLGGQRHNGEFLILAPADPRALREPATPAVG
jgi:hypothetical protein